MRVLVAPAGFKETLTASEAARAMARGARLAQVVRHDLGVDVLPLAGGGGRRRSVRGHLRNYRPRA